MKVKFRIKKKRRKKHLLQIRSIFYSLTDTNIGIVQLSTLHWFKFMDVMELVFFFKFLASPLIPVIYFYICIASKLWRKCKENQNVSKWYDRKHPIRNGISYTYFKHPISTTVTRQSIINITPIRNDVASGNGQGELNCTKASESTIGKDTHKTQSF